MLALPIRWYGTFSYLLHISNSDQIRIQFNTTRSKEKESLSYYYLRCTYGRKSSPPNKDEVSTHIYVKEIALLTGCLTANKVVYRQAVLKKELLKGRIAQDINNNARDSFISLSN